MIRLTFDEREATPFAGGGFSEVYKATYGGRRVAVKVPFRTTDTDTVRRFRKVGGLFLHRTGHSLGQKRLIEEVVGWKWLHHENILPFIGISLEIGPFSIVSELMEHGDIMNFIKVYPNQNRLRLVSGGKTSILRSY